MLSIACGEETHAPNTVRERIGPDGGSISSHDGVLTIAIPTGALDETVEVAVSPSSDPPHVFGPAYRVRPDIGLNADAEITYQRVLPQDPDYAAVGAIRRSDFSDGEGRWSELPRVSIDPASDSITAVDDELSLYYGLLELDGLPPPSATGSSSTGDPGDDTLSAGTESTTAAASTSGWADSTSTSAPGTETTGSTEDGGSATEASTGETSAEESSSGGDLPPMCGDGVPVAGELCYVVGEDFAAGSSPSDLALADFDGDGARDVVTSNRGSADVTVLLGFGDGTFDLPVAYATGAGPSAIGVGDFNQDSNVDVVVTNTDDDTIGLFFGVGDGTFLPQVSYDVGDAPTDLAIAGYGVSPASDLVVVSSGSATIQIFTGSATGVLTPSAPFAVLPEAATAIVAAEYNSDALNDAFVFGSQGSFHGRAGNGAGSFSPGLEISGYYGGDFRRAATGDLDGDGNADVVLVDTSNHTVQVRAGNGAAMFTLVAQPQAGVAPSDVAVADLAGTGLFAAVVTGRDSGDVTILRQPEPNEWVLEDVLPVNASPSGVAIAEVTGDGVLDIVVCNEGSSTITVLTSDP